MHLEGEGSDVSKFVKDPRVAAELMLRYMSSAREPLFGYDSYDAFLLIDTIVNPKTKVKYLQRLFQQFPRKTQDFLDVLFKFLSDVTQQNPPLTSQALGMLFGPLLLRPRETLYYMDNDMDGITNIIRICIENQKGLIAKPIDPRMSHSTSSLPTLPTLPKEI
eukprot:TRINITY_DN3329_c0_g1_i2.p1 TRINITY_DN3329_c0_g1~~TRINITY_DN3329_c0_g1_i2.p1  ORF type:complete len:163 (-),score=36.66 TRINITY_DN3329_c0_g1_i2:66-554(-)